MLTVKQIVLQGWQRFCLVSSSRTMALLWYRN